MSDWRDDEPTSGLGAATRGRRGRPHPGRRSAVTGGRVRRGPPVRRIARRGRRTAPTMVGVVRRASGRRAAARAGAGRRPAARTGPIRRPARCPASLGGDEPSDDDLDSWSTASGSGPRFRTGDGDWAEGDFAEGELAQGQTRRRSARSPTTTSRRTSRLRAADPAARGPRGPARRPSRPPTAAHAAARGRADAAERRPGTARSTAPVRRIEYGEDHEAQPAGADRSRAGSITAVVVAAVALAAFAAGRPGDVAARHRHRRRRRVRALRGVPPRRLPHRDGARPPRVRRDRARRVQPG